MGDPRDRYRPKTPPAGIREQLARPPSARELDELTPVSAISAVRLELRSEISEVRGELGEVRGDVRELAGEVRGLTGVVGGLSGQLEVLPRLVDALTKEREAQRQEDHVVVTTRLDVEKHRAVTEIDQGAAAAAARREWIGKAIIALLGIATTISTAYATGIVGG